MTMRRFEVVVEGRQAGAVDAEALEHALAAIDVDASIRVLKGLPESEDRAVLRALAHPVRRQVLSLLREPRRERLSPTEMARSLTGVNVGLVSYHVQALLRAGLIEPAGQRQVRGAIEHFYRVVDS